MKGQTFFTKSTVTPLAWWNHLSPQTQAAQLKQTLKGDTQCLRLHLSYDAWQRDPRLFLKKLQGAADACQQNGVRLLPVLFQRTTAGRNGGELSLDRILPDATWGYRRGSFQGYFRDVAALLGREGNILFWELCDCPAFGPVTSAQQNLLRHYEHTLRRELYFTLKRAGATQPAGFSATLAAARRLPEDMAEICDLFLLAEPRAMKLYTTQPKNESALYIIQMENPEEMQ